MIEVKGNQKTLLNQVKKIINHHNPLDTYLSQEKSRGRTENRYHEIYDQIACISPEWKGVQRVVYVHRYGHRPDKKSNDGFYSEDHYYIVGYACNEAQQIAQGIRQHWGIENEIHFVKDTHFKEDDNGITNHQAAANLSIFQDIAINIYRCKGFKSLKTATIFFANKVNELFGFLKAQHMSNL